MTANWAANPSKCVSLKVLLKDSLNFFSQMPNYNLSDLLQKLHLTSKIIKFIFFGLSKLNLSSTKEILYVKLGSDAMKAKFCKTMTKEFLEEL